MSKLTSSSITVANPRLARFGSTTRTPRLLPVTLLLWSIALVGLGWLLAGPVVSGSGDRMYLLPWCAAIGVVTLAPLAYLAFKGRFDPFHPLIFPAWSYFFPAFAIGGVILATGYSQAYYIAFIRDEVHDLPLTFLYLIIGFLGLTAGFAFPVSRRLGEIVESRLPHWELKDSDVRTGGTVLLTLGGINILFAYLIGVLGYQRSDEVYSFGGLVLMSTTFWYQAAFILSLYLIRSKVLLIKDYFCIAVLVLSAFANALLNGSRGGLLHYTLPIIAAYFYSGRRIGVKHYLGFGSFVVVTLALGMIYGTTFRNIRGSQEMDSFNQYVAVVPETFGRILEQDAIKVLSESISTFATRIELVSSVAVVVSNYEILAPYEEELGISNNIMVESSTFLIPRLLWADKPTSVDPSKYAELYFNFGENSFSMTPIGDLLRNFGPIGIPIGMFILGGLLRIVHVALVGPRRFSYWRLSLYYLLLTSVSYDSTYGGIIPTMFKTAVVASVGYFIVWLVTVRLDRRKMAPSI